MTCGRQSFHVRRLPSAGVAALLQLGLAIALPVAFSKAQAQPRSSASYTISADTLDSGGGHAASVSYAESASLGTIAGTSDGGAPAHLLKAGLFARFLDPTGLQLVPATGGTLPSVSLPEGTALQLVAYQELDDATFHPVASTAVAWSVVSGPIVSVSPGGLATAGIVYQDTAAQISGTFVGFTDALALTVLNANPDNFGTYGGDGLPDGWQVQYFGLDNPLAHPAVDASGTGQTNLFKYTAGLNPTDPASRFTLEIEPVDGQSAQKDLIFTPVWADRTYLVEYTTDLAGGVWLPLPGGVENTAGQVRTVTDPAATQAAKHYRVRITKP
jgi:hypothetical protein